MSRDEKIFIDKLKHILPYWLNHNNEHILDNEKWLQKAKNLSLKDIVNELEKIVALSNHINKHIDKAAKLIETDITRKKSRNDQKEIPKHKHNDIPKTGKFKFTELNQIGIIKTPYTDKAPYQATNDDEGDFRIILDPEYRDGLFELEKFNYIIIFFYLHKKEDGFTLKVTPPWAHGKQVGLFASRSPSRPNRIGISVVRIKKIINNEIHTYGLDIFDGTPLLDIKPYIKDIDSKPDANLGWLEELDANEHLLSHIKGIPHKH